MGNRCYVVFEDRTDPTNLSPAVYLHWNGGPESVYAFLDAMERYGCLSDPAYAAARFCQIVGNFLGGTLNLGIERFDKLEDLTPGDNGLFVVSWSRSGPEGAPELHVRRYVGRPERWLSDEEVAAEKAAALAHGYRTGQRFDPDKRRYVGPHNPAQTIDAQIDAKNFATFYGEGRYFETHAPRPAAGFKGERPAWEARP